MVSSSNHVTTDNGITFFLWLNIFHFIHTTVSISFNIWYTFPFLCS
jgi:hypothetical protein